MTKPPNIGRRSSELELEKLVDSDLDSVYGRAYAPTGSVQDAKPKALLHRVGQKRAMRCEEIEDRLNEHADAALPPLPLIGRAANCSMHLRHAGHPWPAEKCSCIFGMSAIPGRQKKAPPERGQILPMQTLGREA